MPQTQINTHIKKKKKKQNEQVQILRETKRNGTEPNSREKKSKPLRPFQRTRAYRRVIASPEA